MIDEHSLATQDSKTDSLETVAVQVSFEGGFQRKKKVGGRVPEANCPKQMDQDEKMIFCHCLCSHKG